MNSEVSQDAARVAGHPVLRILISFPIACFTGALATDIVYAFTADITWADFSTWLLAAGIFMSVLAAIGGIVSVFTDRRLRTHGQVWPVVIGSLIVLALALFDNLVHSRDAWTSVVPIGLALSALTVVVMLITAWFGSASRSRQSVGVSYPGIRQ